MKPLTAQDPETHTPDVVAENLERLKELFPEAFAEGRIDFEVLKQLLGGTVDEREEKYGLNWHGKRRARQIALTPSTGTLRPCPEDSVDWDKTQNLMIEGDNLEVLKLLQKSYAGKVKLIYIDPPYNTGKDFVYPDNFQDNIRNYLELTGQIDSDGNKIASNTESSGRFHTDWLNMMYPRLRLARNLLAQDGLLLVSIDDHEASHLRVVCNDVFGEENFIAQFVWNTEGHTDNQFDVKVTHEYVLLFAKDADEAALGHVVDPNTRQESNLWKGFAENSITKNGVGNPPSEVILPPGFPCLSKTLTLPANDVPSDFFSEVAVHGYITREMTERFGVSYPIRRDDMLVEDGRVVTPCRVFSGWANVNKLKAFIANGCDPLEEDGDKLTFYLSEGGVIYYRRDREKARNILSVLRNFGTTERMRSELEDLGIPFQYPKPKELLQYLLQVGLDTQGLVLDFFAGSGTIGEAVYSLNVVDGGARRFILVQLPESTRTRQDDGQWNETAVSKAGFGTIADITKERLRKVAKKIRGENPMFAGDLGFRVLKLDSSNIRAWEPNRDDLPATLQDSVQHLKTDRTEQDILFELLLKLGLDLTVPVVSKTIAGKDVHSIGAGALISCLAEQIAGGDVEPLALGIAAWHKELAPSGETMVVFRDSAFGDDVAKTNLTAILQQHGLENVRSL